MDQLHVRTKLSAGQNGYLYLTDVVPDTNSISEILDYVSGRSKSKIINIEITREEYE